MRKLILMSVLVLASATAQAGQTRGFILAANDDEKIETIKPEAAKGDVKPESSKPVKEVSRPKASRPAKEASRPVKEVSRPIKRGHARAPEDDEAKARGIAARYGVSW